LLGEVVRGVRVPLRQKPSSASTDLAAWSPRCRKSEGSKRRNPPGVPPESPVGRNTAAHMAAARSWEEREASDELTERMDVAGPAVDTGIGRSAAFVSSPVYAQRDPCSVQEIVTQNGRTRTPSQKADLVTQYAFGKCWHRGFFRRAIRACTTCMPLIVRGHAVEDCPRTRGVCRTAPRGALI
jgi:hypothetical protein